MYSSGSISRIVVSGSASRTMRTAFVAASPASFHPSNATTRMRPRWNRFVWANRIASVCRRRSPIRNTLGATHPGPWRCSLCASLSSSAMTVPVLPAAVLWDMDGTLVDTEPFWFAAETELVARFGGLWTHEQALTLVGSGLRDGARVLQDHGVGMTVD